MIRGVSKRPGPGIRFIHVTDRVSPFIAAFMFTFFMTTNTFLG